MLLKKLSRKLFKQIWNCLRKTSRVLYDVSEDFITCSLRLVGKVRGIIFIRRIQQTRCLRTYDGHCDHSSSIYHFDAVLLKRPSTVKNHSPAEYCCDPDFLFPIAFVRHISQTTMSASSRVVRNAAQASFMSGGTYHLAILFTILKITCKC